MKFKVLFMLLTVFFVHTPLQAQTDFWRQTSGPYGGVVSKIDISRTGVLWMAAIIGNL